MKKWSKLIVIPLLFAMIAAACSNSADKNDDSAATPSAGQAAETPSASAPSEGGAVDPFRLPEPVKVSIVKSVDPDLKLPEGDTIRDNEFTRYVSQKTNVNFELLWYASGQDFEQKQKLMIASNDLPDAMEVDERTFRSLAEAGQLEDLTEVFEKYASPQLKEYYASSQGKALEKATYNGKLLALPNLVPQADSAGVVWIRKDWLDKLGLQDPETLDDIENIAKTFIAENPGNHKDGTVGMTGSPDIASGSYTGMHTFKGLFNALNAYPMIWYRDDSGKLVYGSTTQEAKASLAKIHDWYEQGLIDKEFAIRKSPDELVVSGRTGIFFGPWWAPWSVLGNAVMNDPKADWKPYMLKGTNGKVNATVTPPSGWFLVVKKGFQHPEALVVNMNFKTKYERTPDAEDLKLDSSLFDALYPLRLITIDYIDAVDRKHDAMMKVLNGQMSPDELTPEMKRVYEGWQRDQQNTGTRKLEDWQAGYAYIYGGAAVKQIENKVFPIFTASTPTMEKRMTNLLKLENETYLKIVLGRLPVDAFDAFVNDWNKQGGEQIAKEIEKELTK